MSFGMAAGMMGKSLRGTQNYRPEKPVKAKKRDKRDYDSPQQIAACLHCTEKECRRGTCARVMRLQGLREGMKENAFGRVANRWEYQGRKYTAAELGREAGVSADLIRRRLKRRWSVEEAVAGHRMQPAERRSV